MPKRETYLQGAQRELANAFAARRYDTDQITRDLMNECERKRSEAKEDANKRAWAYRRRNCR
jgi:hypothetical protein